jgi:hypothetical protein
MRRSVLAFCGVLGVAVAAAGPAFAQYHYPPPGYRPPPAYGPPPCQAVTAGPLRGAARGAAGGALFGAIGGNAGRAARIC